MQQTPPALVPNVPISVAPMVGCTDRYFRRLLREITRETTLYTEMAVAAGVVRNPTLLNFDAKERPLILQLAGDKPDELRHAAKLAEARGFDGLNLNFGCPSKAATAGGYGACMMQKPESAVRAFAAVQEASRLPVSVKCRLGIQENSLSHQDESQDFFAFIEALQQAGCTRFILHARKAWLKGLSPRANRTRPPLNYDLVFAAAQEFPTADFILNGGLTSPEQGLAVARQHCAGVMLGRAVWNNPWCLAQADELIHPHSKPRATPLPQDEILLQMIALSEAALAEGARVPSVLRGLARMWRARRGAAEWRARLATIATEQARAQSKTSLASLRLLVERQLLLEPPQKLSLQA